MKLSIDSFSGGISPSDRIGREGSFFIGSAATIYNPLHMGYLTPGPNFSNISHTPSQVNSMALNDDDNLAYLIERGSSANLHKYRLVEEVISSTGDWPHAIYATSGGAGEDVVLYPVGDTNYLFYSYNNYTATSGNVGRCTLGTGATTFDDDFMLKEPAGGDSLGDDYPHPMMEWPESGYLYVADGRNLHQFDGQTGASGTLTADKLQLPRFWVITSLFDAGEYIGITAQYYPGTGWSWPDWKERVAVFFWDGTSDSWNRQVNIPDKEIRASIAKGGEYFTFGTNPMGEGTIRKWDGRGFKLTDIIRTNVARGGTKSKYSSHVITYRGVDYWSDALVFGSEHAGDSWIFLHGSPQPGFPSSLFQVAFTDTVSEIYAVKEMGGDIFYSVWDRSNNIDYFSKLNMAQSDSPSFLYKSIYYEFPEMIRINYVKLYFKTLTTGQGVDVSVETGYGDATTAIGDVAYAIDGAVPFKKLSGRKVPACDNFRIIIDPDEGSDIKYGKIEVDYDFVKTPE